MNGYSSWFHTPASVGSTPTPATKLIFGGWVRTNKPILQIVWPSLVQFLPTINICWLSVIGSTAVSKTAGIGSSPIANARAGLA